VLAEKGEGFRRGALDGKEVNFWDKVFLNEINISIEAMRSNYAQMAYYMAIVNGFYRLSAARDAYRSNSGDSMHFDVLLRYLRVYAIMISPICPSFAQHGTCVCMCVCMHVLITLLNTHTHVLTRIHTPYTTHTQYSACSPSRETPLSWTSTSPLLKQKMSSFPRRCECVCVCVYACVCMYVYIYEFIYV
jgi:hypothetical protein